jgi:tetratricopeptide (TPR) repeat protein
LNRVYCRAAALVAACVATLSCSRSPSDIGPQRIAILRFENLSSDTSLDWMGRAFSEVITRDLTATPGIYALPFERLHSLDPSFGSRPLAAPGISTERSLALVSGATRLGYGQYWLGGGKIEAKLTLEDPRSGKVVQEVSASAAAGDPVSAASALAKQVSSQAGQYLTGNSAALKSYALALEAPDVDTMVSRLEEALAADSNYSAPYTRLAQAKLQRQDRTGAAAILQQAISHGDHMPELERARLEFEAASLGGDRSGARRSLTTWARLTPNDPVVWQSMAQTNMNSHRYVEAERAYQRALAASPDDVNLLNELGYAAAYADDLNAATQALQRYQALRPGDANPFDSLGDVYLMLGRLREAEASYLAAAKKDPGFLNGGDFFKAAMARLMTGDVTGADGIAKQFTDYRAAAKDALIDFEKAQWAWISGRRKIALDAMAAFAQSVEGGALREAASEAYSQLALWDVALGDRSAAAQMAEKAGRLAGPSSAELAKAARFLAQPSASPADWQERAESFYPSPTQQQAQELTLSYALLTDKQYQQAVPLLEALYENTPPTADDLLPLLLGWAYLETGRQNDAAALLRFNPLPANSGVTRLAEFYFPRLFYLRGRIARLRGRPNETRENYRLFLKLSGDQPLVWGEEAMAR